MTRDERQIDLRIIEQSRPKATTTSNPKTISIWSREIKFTNSTLSDKFKEDFYLQLQTLLEAGLDIKASLDLIAGSMRKKRLKETVTKITNDLMAGLSLNETMSTNPGFTVYESQSIKIGEETGRLTYILNELSKFFASRIRQRRQIVSALTYPILVVTIAMGAVTFMLKFVVPMFADVLKRFGGELPTITKVVVSISVLFQRYLAMILICVAGGIFAILLARKTKKFQKVVAQISLRIPLIGNIIRKVQVAKLGYTMSLLLGSKIPLVPSLELAKSMSSFFPIIQSLDQTVVDILDGLSLHESFSNSKLFPKKFVAFVKVGEETNRLPEFFSKIADQFSDETEHQISAASKFIEPIIIVVLGLIVGIILISMYLPLFKLGQTI